MHAAREHSGGGPTICICVDDFGLYAGVNEAALQLADAGTVHAVGCMVGAPLWRAGGVHLRSRRGLHAGLHLDFTEHPLHAEARQGLPTLIASSYAGTLDRGLVRREIREQLDAFEAVMGRPPDFVDGHQHVHQLPVIRDELLDELAQRYGGTAFKPWLRSTRAAAAASFKARLIEQLGARALAARARRAGFAQNARLLGVYDFSGGARRYAALLRGWIAAAAPGDLLMCHPSRLAAADDPLGAARVAEFEVLSRPGLLARALQAAGLGLAPVRRS